MRLLYLILLVFILTPFVSLGQTYEEYTLKATELYQNKEYQESSDIWDKEFQIHM